MKAVLALHAVIWTCVLAAIMYGLCATPEPRPASRDTPDRYGITRELRETEGMVRLVKSGYRP